MSQKTILTGIATTGRPHLGNYAGAIRPAIEHAVIGLKFDTIGARVKIRPDVQMGLQDAFRLGFGTGGIKDDGDITGPTNRVDIDVSQAGRARDHHPSGGRCGGLIHQGQQRQTLLCLPATFHATYPSLCSG